MSVLSPEEAERLARAALAEGRLDAAESLSRALLSTGDGSARVWSLLAAALRRQGRYEETRKIQEMLVEMAPANFDLHFDLAETLLLLGDFERGWREYHHRYRLQHTSHLERKVQRPRWDGREMPGQTLLIHDEQGFGDTFQFLRMVPWAKKRSGARLVLQITAEQESFARRMKGIDEIVLRGQLPPAFDMHCEMMSLPMAMGLKLPDLPGAIPYLSQDKGRVARWRKRLAGLPRPLVALVWAGRPNHFNDPNRSMSLADLAPLVMPEVTFISVQKGPKAEAATAPPEGMNLIDLGPEIADFDDTAAIFGIADLLISVDSSPVHLAGALGRPAWVMLPFAPDWRWLLERDDTPWYPSLRLYRQSVAGDWAGVVERMAADLARLAGRAEPPPRPPRRVPAGPAILPPVRKLADCRHGKMLFLPHDLYVGRSLDLYGEFSEGELRLFSGLIRPGDLVVEVGANIGAHTVALGKMAGPQGRVLAFEPQRILCQILAANVALNGQFNIVTRQEAVGAVAGSLRVPPLDYGHQFNFGGVSLVDSDRGDPVAVITLDSLDLPVLRLLKIDAEGMEAEVLSGARATIARCQPVLYVENDRREKSAALITLLGQLGYACWWDLPMLFNPGNFAGNGENVFPGVLSINMLCLPEGSPLKVEGCRRVSGPDDWWDV